MREMEVVLERAIILGRINAVAGQGSGVDSLKIESQSEANSY